LRHLLALHVTPTNPQDRAQVGELAQHVQAVTGDKVEVAFVDQGYPGETAQVQADPHGLQLEVVKLPDVKKGFVLLTRRWVFERNFRWLARLRRLACDDERLPATLKGLHSLAFAMLMAHRFVQLLAYCR
jgi:transposase